jgi:hypothetical protein
MRDGLFERRVENMSRITRRQPADFGVGAAMPSGELE